MHVPIFSPMAREPECHLLLSKAVRRDRLEEPPHSTVFEVCLTHSIILASGV